MVPTRSLRTALALTSLLAVPFAGCASAPKPEAASAESAGQHVDGATAKKLVKEGARLVDVRTPAEYAERHIEGAENVPVDTIAERDLGPKDAPVVLYCKSGKRAARAAEALRAKGYSRVYELGAMKSWGD